jgi:hypothetical protein
MAGAEGFKVSSPSDHFALASLVFKGKPDQIQACPSFPILLSVGRIPKEVGITGSRRCYCSLCASAGHLLQTRTLALSGHGHASFSCWASISDRVILWCFVRLLCPEISAVLGLQRFSKLARAPHSFVTHPLPCFSQIQFSF